MSFQTRADTVVEERVLERYQSAPAEVWNAEYRSQHTIPSSARHSPAKALLALQENFSLTGKRILDLGCGNGRNAVYLAQSGFEVTAVDFSDVAIELASSEAFGTALRKNVSLQCYDFSSGIKSKNDFFDIILDSYCLCHVIDPSTLAYMRQECARILRPSGILIKIHLDDADIYYKDRTSYADAISAVSYDGVNGIAKRHFSLDTYTRYMAPNFSQCAAVHLRFEDNVRGMTYLRSVFAAAFAKVG